MRRYFDNLDGAHVRDPKPIAAYLWGAGAATYYGSGNGTGKQEAVKVPDAGFETPGRRVAVDVPRVGGTYRAAPLPKGLPGTSSGRRRLAARTRRRQRFTVGLGRWRSTQVGRLTGPARRGRTAYGSCASPTMR